MPNEPKFTPSENDITKFKHSKKLSEKSDCRGSYDRRKKMINLKRQEYGNKCAVIECDNLNEEYVFFPTTYPEGIIADGYKRYLVCNLHKRIIEKLKQ